MRGGDGVIGLAWICAVAGLGLGLVLVLVPGIPGSAVALLGLVAFAGLTDFSPVDQRALAVAAGLAAIGVLGQALGPPIASRGLGGGAGAATGSALGACLGAFVPIPGALWVAAVVGAVIGAALGGSGWFAGVRGVSGAAAGCVVAAAWDFVGVLGVGAVLAVADVIQNSAA
ncbi:MAG: hypothetical protein ACI8PZ_004819 [Myxococcota bacterium]|jgi:uncharacterized protein YqgC (DUF456 family)